MVAALRRVPRGGADGPRVIRLSAGVRFPAGDAVYVDTLTVYVAEMFPKHPRFGSIEQLGDQPLDQRDRTAHLAASACVEGRHLNVVEPRLAR